MTLSVDSPPILPARAERLLPADLAPLAVDVRLAQDDLRVPWLNLSARGLALAWPHAEPPDVGDVVGPLSVRFAGEEVWTGTAEVRWVRVVDDRYQCGCALVAGAIPVSLAHALARVGRWADTDPPSARPRLGRDGAERFMAMVGELRVYLDQAQVWCEGLEAAFPDAALDPVGNPVGRALRARVERDFVPGFVSRSDAANAAWLELRPEWRMELLPYSRGLLQELLDHSPLMRRALAKPLGYPGDFEVMRYLYEREFEGETLFARALTLAVARTGSCEAVRARKDLLREVIERALARAWDAGRPASVLCLASGPAQEVVELFESHPGPLGPVRIGFVEMEKQALAWSGARLRDALARHPSADVTLHFFHDRIRRRMSPAWVANLGPFDLIYSAGLYDYLPRPVAVELTRSLTTHLAPDGELWVGNMVPSTPSRWLMDLHLDWHLQHRTFAELLDLGHAGAPQAESWVVPDRTQYNPFLVVRRRPDDRAAR